MRSFEGKVLLISLLISPLPVLAGADTFSIDDLMQMVEEESRIETSPKPEQEINAALLSSPPRDSVNKTEQPTVVSEREIQNISDDKPLKVGAREFAISAGCAFMQIYRVATDTDFTKTLDLVKYRSSALGAEYLTIVYHQEGIMHNLVEAFFNSTYLLTSETSKPAIKTVMIAEMYDCEG